MAVAFIQNAFGSTVGAANPAATFGSGPTQNNLMTAQLFTKADTGATNPSGWSTAIDVVNGGAADTLRIAYKVAGAGESSTVTFTVAADNSALGIYEFSGTATSSPLDRTASTPIATAVTTISSGTPGTTSQADEVSVAAFGFRGVPTTPTLDGSFNKKNVVDSTGAAPADLVDGYRIETTTGTPNTNCSWTGALDTMGALATFKGLATGSATIVMGPSLPTNRFVGPTALRFKAKRVVLDTTIAMPTDTATGPLPVIIPNPTVGPLALRPRARWQTFWDNAPSSVLNNYVLSADSGVYTLTGAVATILRAALLKANPGTYTITGQTAATLAGRLIKANSGVYNLTGQPATLLTTRLLNAGPGTYNLTGQTVKITAARLLNATPGAYNVTGSSASLLKGYLIKANPGSYTITGATARTLTTRLLSAAAGVYAIDGKTAGLIYTPVGPTASNLLLDTTNGHIIKQVTTNVYIDLNNGHLIWKVL